MLGEESALLRTFGRGRDGKADLVSLNGLLVHETGRRRDKFWRRWFKPQHRCVEQSGFCRRMPCLCHGNMLHPVDQSAGGICSADFLRLVAEFSIPGTAAALMTGPAEIQL